MKRDALILTAAFEPHPLCFSRASTQPKYATDGAGWLFRVLMLGILLAALDFEDGDIVP